MSSDNGVYILHTKDGYRVEHCQAIENIYWWYTCCNRPDIIQTFEDDIFYNKKCLNCGTNKPSTKKREEICPDRLEEYFGNCKVLKTLEDAKKEAIKLYLDVISDDFCPIVEYGIGEINAEHIDLRGNNETFKN